MLEGFRLEMPSGDVDNDGVDEYGVFEGNVGLRIEQGTRTGFLVESGGGLTGSINSIVVDWWEEKQGEQLSGDGKRQGWYLDLGAGQHYAEISFRGFEGSDGQWGSSPDPAVQTAASATGAHPTTQMQVLDRYLQICTVDSKSPATLHVGEYSDAGRYGPLEVVIEDPSFTYDVEEPSIYDGSITFLEAMTLGEFYDAHEQQQH
ncbi:hypothetical protein [Halomarina rubra]|uniref:Uncharacterized protein n=1 Tax=Halomarina rubra TaxID=2071873 RepID=A0ABD6ASG5_9EURY|nr:hypothetical protein [Halomarina rubra]